MASNGEIKGLDQVRDGLRYYVQGTHENARHAAEEIGGELVFYALYHHPWKVDTGFTNVTTKFTVIETNDLIRIVLSAGMSYDVFLETFRSGKWAWLLPAIIANKAKITGILVKWMGRANVKGGRRAL